MEDIIVVGYAGGGSGPVSVTIGSSLRPRMASDRQMQARWNPRTVDDGNHAALRHTQDRGSSIAVTKTTEVRPTDQQRGLMDRFFGPRVTDGLGEWMRDFFGGAALGFPHGAVPYAGLVVARPMFSSRAMRIGYSAGMLLGGIADVGAGSGLAAGSLEAGAVGAVATGPTVVGPAAAAALGLTGAVVGGAIAVGGVVNIGVALGDLAPLAVSAFDAGGGGDVKDIPHGEDVPFRGEPGSTTRGTTKTRTYDEDGYPKTDRETGHPNEKGTGCGEHCHDWGRPSDGRPPTKLDRGPSRLPTPNDPPSPRGGKVPPP